MSISKADLNFIYEIGNLRWIMRMWQRFGGINFQNLTEHIYRVAWIALILAKHEKVADTDKILKMALVHDIGESRAGDVDYLARQYVERNEIKAIKEMLSDTALATEFIGLWEEYERRECIEAKIVKDADNLDVDFELREQQVKGESLASNWSQGRRFVAENKLYTKTAKKIWDQIYTSNPHAWHIDTNNRFTAGDWQKKK